ncbi:MAG: M23 family metallopeptidase [Bacteroidetes bacterium]|nr:MAG: M23 family metallopeptidase [Bacteroidota bacterium]
MKYAITIIVLILGCNVNKLPKKKLSQTSLNLDYEYVDNGVHIIMKNPLRCPVRIWVKSEDPTFNSYLQQYNPISLESMADTVINYETNEIRPPIYFSAKLGDPSREVTATKVDLPFPKNRTYKLIQGYNSTPTHNLNTSRYALDFDLGIGDTICAATGGYVVGVIEDYQYGGKGKKWKPYGNFITIYEPSSGLFTQYAHLQYKGSFVEVGDSIHRGQAIGLAGMTGQTNTEHLHFNCLKPDSSKDGFVSLPMDSIGNYKISEIKRYDIVKN